MIPQMMDTPWNELFEPRSKEAWIQKIKADAKGSFSEDQLTFDLGEGLQMHAIQTRQDLQDLPHLNKSSVYNSLVWQRDSEWKIGFPIQLGHDPQDTTVQIQKGISWGAESVIIEQNSDIGLNEEVFVSELRSQLVNYTVDVHFRPSNRHSHIALPHSSPRYPNVLGTVLCELSALLADRKETPNSLIGNQLQIIAHIGSNFYLEIARLRALKHLIIRWINQQIPEFKDDVTIPVFAELQSLEKTPPSPADSLLHHTTTAMAAILGGCSTLVIHPHADLDNKDRNEMMRLAINLQLMLRHEAHLGRVSDPAAGSYYIEVLTHQLIQSAWEYYERER